MYIPDPDEEIEDPQENFTILVDFLKLVKARLETTSSNRIEILARRKTDIATAKERKRQERLKQEDAEGKKRAYRAKLEDTDFRVTLEYALTAALTLIGKDIADFNTELTRDENRELYESIVAAIDAIKDKYVTEDGWFDWDLFNDLEGTGLGGLGNYDVIVMKIFGVDDWEKIKKIFTKKLDDSRLIPRLSYYISEITNKDTIDALESWLTDLETDFNASSEEKEFKALAKLIEPLLAKGTGYKKSVWLAQMGLHLTPSKVFQLFIAPRTLAYVSKKLGIELKGIKASSKEELLKEIGKSIISTLKAKVEKQKRFAQAYAAGVAVEKAFSRALQLIEDIKKAPSPLEATPPDTLTKQIKELTVDALKPLPKAERLERIRQYIVGVIEKAHSAVSEGSLVPQEYVELLKEITEPAVKLLLDKNLDLDDETLETLKDTLIKTIRLTNTGKEVDSDDFIKLKETTEELYGRISKKLTDEQRALKEIKAQLNGFTLYLNKRHTSEEIKAEFRRIKGVISENLIGITKADHLRELSLPEDFFEKLDAALADEIVPITAEEAQESPELKPDSWWRTAAYYGTGAILGTAATIATGGGTLVVAAAGGTMGAVLGGAAKKTVSYVSATKRSDDLTAEIRHLIGDAITDTAAIIKTNGETLDSLTRLGSGIHSITEIIETKKYAEERAEIEKLESTIKALQTDLNNYNKLKFKWLYKLAIKFGINPRKKLFEAYARKEEIQKSTTLIEERLRQEKSSTGTPPPIPTLSEIRKYKEDLEQHVENIKKQPTLEDSIPDSSTKKP